MDFDFAAMYSFLLSALSMLLAYLSGKRSKKRKKKSRPPGKVNGSKAYKD